MELKPLWLYVHTLHFDNKAFQTEVAFRDFMSSILISFVIWFVHADLQQRGIKNLNLEIPYNIWFQLKLPHSISVVRPLLFFIWQGLNWMTFLMWLWIYLGSKFSICLVYLSKILFGCSAIEEFHAVLVWILRVWNLINLV
jgi:hypothetical protein